MKGKRKTKEVVWYEVFVFFWCLLVWSLRGGDGVEVWMLGN